MAAWMGVWWELQTGGWKVKGWAVKTGLNSAVEKAC